MVTPVKETESSSDINGKGGSTDDDIIESGFDNIIDDIRKIASDADDIREVGVSDNDARGVH